MSRGWFVSLAIAFAIGLTACVIVVGRYYESLGLLPVQILLIAGPTLTPFIVAAAGRRGILSGLLIALIVAAGWAYAVYIDTLPYQGGGASFATLFGWAGCAVASTIALFLVLIEEARVERVTKAGEGRNETGLPR